MSVKIMGQVWDLELPAAKLLVLLALTDHADHNGENIFPSMELVAWKTGYSERQVRRIIKSLVNDEILSAQSRPGKTTIYSVHLDKGKQKEPFKRSSMVGQNVTPDIAVSPQVGHSYDTPTPDIAMTPEPSLEPSINLVAPNGADKSRTTPISASEMNPMKDAIALAFHYKWEKMTVSEKGLVQKAARELCLANVTPADVPLLYAYCAKQFTKFKPMALPGNLSEWRKSQAIQKSALDGLRIVS